MRSDPWRSRLYEDSVGQLVLALLANQVRKPPQP